MNRIANDFLDLPKATQDMALAAIEAVAEGTWRDWIWYQDPVYPDVVHIMVADGVDLEWRVSDDLPDHVQLLRLGDPTAL